MIRKLSVCLVAVVLLSACSGTGTESTKSEETSASTASASPTAAEAAIPGDGTYTVGSDVQAGVYVAEGGDQCSWQRLSDPAGGPGDVIAQGLPLPRPVVEITSDDAAFKSEGCGSWTALDDYTGPQATEIPGNGIWIVNQDLVPGTYKAEGGDLCMWQRLNAFTPDLDSVIRMGGDPKVTIESGDIGFLTSACGSWTKIG